MKDVGYCSRPDEVELLEGVSELLPRLKNAGFKLIIVTNQSGIGRGYFTEEDFWAVQQELQKQLGADVIDATYFCADTPQQESERRKPNPGMLLEAATDLSIDLDAELHGRRQGFRRRGRDSGRRQSHDSIWH